MESLHLKTFADLKSLLPVEFCLVCCDLSNSFRAMTAFESFFCGCGIKNGGGQSEFWFSLHMHCSYISKMRYSNASQRLHLALINLAQVVLVVPAFNLIGLNVTSFTALLSWCCLQQAFFWMKNANNASDYPGEWKPFISTLSRLTIITCMVST